MVSTILHHLTGYNNRYSMNSNVIKIGVMVKVITFIAALIIRIMKVMVAYTVVIGGRVVETA